jgi:hypothetical protein
MFDQVSIINFIVHVRPVHFAPALSLSVPTTRDGRRRWAVVDG